MTGDSLDEDHETFLVNLSAASNATLADGQGQGTIRDNDSTPSLNINDVTVTEGTGGSVEAVFTVMLFAASGQPVSLNFATSKSTAVAPDDFALARRAGLRALRQIMKQGVGQFDGNGFHSKIVIPL